MALREPEPLTVEDQYSLMTEILKQSNIPPAALCGLVPAEPRLEDISLPQGRSFRQCQRAFNQLKTAYTTGSVTPRPRIPIQPYGVEIQSSQISPDPRKRPRASMEAPMSVGTPLQPLQPRPPTSTFNPLNGDDPLQGSPEVYDPNQPAKKKRGRPTKAEAERRKHEAEARGEPYPPPKTPKAPKAPKPEIGARSSLGSAEGSGLGEVSFSGAQTPILAAEQSPVQQPAEAPETGSASKRKRARPGKSETEEQGATKEAEILTSAGPSPRTEAPPDPVPPSLSTTQGPPPLLHAHPEQAQPVVADVPMTGTETAPTVAFSQPPSTNTQA